MTERITEDFVRSHFKSDPIIGQVVLEEQKSTRDRIKALFAGASKNSTGNAGYPEFIVSFAGKPNIILIVECKKDKAHHESSTRDKPKGYAVDGILHYIHHAKSVDKDLAIIGIAVSGRDADHLATSTFYSPPGEISCSETVDTSLLSIQSYLRIAENAAFAKDLSDVHIQQKAVEYNDILHRYEIPENERCTFISAALVALQDDFFRSSYASATDVREVVSAIIEACKRVLKKNGITEERRETIIRQYEQIKGHKITNVRSIKNRITGLEEENDAVSVFIRRLHNEVYPLALYEEQGFDVLGRFYREFVRYAGSDQATGLVLTPEHITDLFCDLVRLQPNDVVYDPCCGTGGFLIAALKRMVSQSGNDIDRILAIKERQLIGSEVRADMFTYACSNMMMRGDGKSQIYNEDCFSASHKARVRKARPTVAMLNPPYSKTNGPANQLRFVLNALEDLQPAGRCAAIVQMSCALTTKKEVVEKHKELLKSHRLDAVITMPDQLFYPVAVNTCIMVFTAHVPHPENHPTWFGYLKDDGFVLHKRRGRVPSDWETKRRRFLGLYPHYDAPGLAIRHAVGAADEWCAEAYLETDYSQIDWGTFAGKVRSYLASQFLSGRLPSIGSTTSGPTSPLDPANWRAFRYDEVFHVKKGYYNKKPPITDDNQAGIPFIGATEYSNGVTAYCALEDIQLYSRNGEENPYENITRKIFAGQALTVSNNGSVGNAFYQASPFTCSHDVNPLYLRDRPMSPELGMFLAALIEVEKYRWGYGRKWRPARMPSSIIRLPVTADGKIDWLLIETFVKSLPHSADLKRVISSALPQSLSGLAMATELA
ncbi:N-6 DNA methylase [Brevundimonas diminuta]|uniref:N-6 DNA methylase n=1 Tax=Brevundimonas diminuta TaxID=293 RepID=UPI003D9A5B69